MIDKILLIQTLGIPGHHRGFSFLLDCLNLSLYHEELLTPITKRLYPQVAERHQISTLCIERDIRTVVKVWWKRGDRTFISNLVGTLAKLPTNKEFIYLLNTHFTRYFSELETQKQTPAPAEAKPDNTAP